MLLNNLSHCSLNAMSLGTAHNTPDDMADKAAYKVPNDAERVGNQLWDDGFYHGAMAVVEANIDDMNPEFYTTAMESLFSVGAVDVFMTPIIMKKGRPANILTALTPPEALNKVVETIFHQTTSIGLRISSVEKRFLPRKVVELTTPWGSVKAKACYLHDELVNLAPEFEDCRSLSAETGVPVKEIYHAARLVGE